MYLYIYSFTASKKSLPKLLPLVHPFLLLMAADTQQITHTHNTSTPKYVHMSIFVSMVARERERD